MTAKSVSIDAGRDLLLVSQQNQHTADGRSFSLSVSFTGGVPTGASIGGAVRGIKNVSSMFCNSAAVQGCPEQVSAPWMANLRESGVARGNYCRRLVVGAKILSNPLCKTTGRLVLEGPQRRGQELPVAVHL